MSTLPFAPHSTTDFLYDPFSVDFENPFGTEDEDMNQPNILDI
jgi:predicted membrane chloride channel (bestrophin family)